MKISTNDQQMNSSGGSDPSCTSVLLSSDSFKGTCTESWANLKPLILPTQSDLGYAWVARKFDKNFGSSKDAQKEMDDNPVPVVMGPVSTTSASVGFYMYDHHHTLAALDYSGYDDTTVTVIVTCDWRSQSNATFWANMDANYVYSLARDQGNLSALPAPMASPQADLPSSFAFTSSSTTFGDDPYRSLASFVRKVENSSCTDDESKYCERGYDRVCNAQGSGIPFFEFMWAYYTNSVVLASDSGNDAWWPSPDDAAAFNQAWDALAPSSVTKLTSVDLDAWGDAATLLVPLCRGTPTGRYELPTSAGFAYSALPGYVQGWEALPGDPDCALAACAKTSSAK